MSEPTVAQSDPAPLPAIASDDLWTSDSQRADANATVELAPDEPATPEPEPTSEPPKPDEFKNQPRVGKPRNDPKARVEQATSQAAAAKEEARKQQERADRLERELTELRARPTPDRTPQTTQQPVSAPSDGRPKWTDFEKKIGLEGGYDSWGDATDAYNGAWLEWKDDEREWKTALTDIAQATASDPTLKKAAELPCSPVMGRAIRDSKKRLDILRYLSTHPEECIQLARESDRTSLDAVPVMRRYLEAQVTAGAVAQPDSAPAVQPSTANPPVNRVGGAVSATVVDPDDLDFGPEFLRRENARDKKRQEASRW